MSAPTEHSLSSVNLTNDAVREVADLLIERDADLLRLIAIADRMYTENAAKAQAEHDAKYQAEFGHNGPRLASPLDSAGREYVYWRHRLGRKHNLPDAMYALGQRS